ncbi:hypothetical protein F4774DRAFT_104664 [Daldinia eschscholtzii]|nr:hypothetical protein F4774DRAFT_104664 [Daldinia eschscholtzii]
MTKIPLARQYGTADGYTRWLEAHEEDRFYALLKNSQLSRHRCLGPSLMKCECMYLGASSHLRSSMRLIMNLYLISISAILVTNSSTYPYLACRGGVLGRLEYHSIMEPSYAQRPRIGWKSTGRDDRPRYQIKLPLSFLASILSNYKPVFLYSALLSRSCLVIRPVTIANSSI